MNDSPSDNAAISGAGSRHAYIILRGLVIPLEEGKVFALGRDMNCEIMLVDDRVSKRHALITFKNSRFHIEDLGSTNGTYINRVRIKNSMLVPGDEIMIQPYTMSFNMHANGVRESKALPVEILDEAGKPKHHFSGLISSMPLSDLIQLLHVTKRSGTLLVQPSNGSSISLHIKEGNLLDATSDSLQGEDAVYAAIGVNEGEFKFSEGMPAEPKEPMPMNTLGLLLEGTRRLDETAPIKMKEPPPESPNTIAVKRANDE